MAGCGEEGELLLDLQVKLANFFLHFCDRAVTNNLDVIKVFYSVYCLGFFLLIELKLCLFSHFQLRSIGSLFCVILILDEDRQNSLFC